MSEGPHLQYLRTPIVKEFLSSLRTLRLCVTLSSLFSSLSSSHLAPTPPTIPPTSSSSSNPTPPISTPATPPTPNQAHSAQRLQPRPLPQSQNGRINRRDPRRKEPTQTQGTNQRSPKNRSRRPTLHPSLVRRRSQRPPTHPRRPHSLPTWRLRIPGRPLIAPQVLWHSHSWLCSWVSHFFPVIPTGEPRLLWLGVEGPWLNV